MLRAALLCSVFFTASLTTLVEVVPPEVPLSNRVLFLVDVSGSMSGFKFDRACSAVLEISSQPTDDMQFALLAFDDVTRRWPGFKDEEGSEELPWGWATLPSEEALERSTRWLSTQTPQGGTRLIQALKSAMAEDRERLSIVLVSDGMFYQETTQEILDAVERCQQEREARGAGRAVLLVYGVSGGGSHVLEQLGKHGRGGFFREDDPPPLPAWSDRPVQVLPSVEPDADTDVDAGHRRIR